MFAVALFFLGSRTIWYFYFAAPSIILRRPAIGSRRQIVYKCLQSEAVLTCSDLHASEPCQDTSANMPSGSQSDPHIVLVLGKTGVGKSTLSCWLADSCDTSVYAVSHDKEAGTVEVGELETPVKYFGGHIHGPDFGDGSNFSDMYIRIIDVPGLGGNVPGKTDGDVLRAMKEYLMSKCTVVSAIVWLEESNLREDSSRQRMVADYVDFLGIEALKNLVVVCNKASNNLTSKVEDEEENDDANDSLDKFSASFKKMLQDSFRTLFCIAQPVLMCT